MQIPPDHLSTPSVHLRRWRGHEGADLDAAIEASRLHLTPFMPWASTDATDPAFRPNWLRERVHAFDAGASFAYGMFDALGAVMGGCGIEPLPGDEASIGYWVHASHVRRGVGTSAANALTQAALNAGCRRVWLRHDEANVGSRAIAERLGYTLVRSEPHSIDAPGQTGTSLVWAFEAASVDDRWTTRESLLAAKQRMIDAMPGYAQPAAYSVARRDGDALVYGHVNERGGSHQLPAVVLATVSGYRNGDATITLSCEQFAEAVRLLAPAGACLEFDHPNLWSWQPLLSAASPDASFVVFFEG